MRRREVVGALAACGALGAARRLHAQPAHGVPLQRVRTGDIGLLAFAEARIGGQAALCLLDTGTTTALVTPALAHRLGLAERGRVPLAAPGGRVEARVLTLPALELAGQRLGAPSAIEFDLESLFADAGVAIDALIGMPQLRPQRWRFDVPGGRLQALPGETSSAAAELALPLEWDAGLPVLRLALGDRPPEPFLLDTGNAGALVVFAHRAASLWPDEAAPAASAREAGGSVVVRRVLLERLHAPGWQARQVPTALEAGPQARRGAHFDRLSGSVGMALFGAGGFTLDAPRSQLLLPAADVGVPGGFGLTLARRAGVLTVDTVLPGGPAAEAGVVAGMALHALDGAATGGLPPAEVWARLAGSDAARFAFRPTDGPVREVVLARRRFFPARL